MPNQQLLLLFPGRTRCNRRMDDPTGDRRGTRRGRAAAQAAAHPARRDPRRSLGDDRHLQEHAVAAGDRPAPAEPGGAAAPGAGLPGAAGRAGRRPRGGRPAGAPEAAAGERPHGASPDPAARRRTGVEDPDPGEPERAPAQGHEGYEWLYVISGQMRLVLGDHDLVLSAGEAAEFDTRQPHWFGSAGGGPAEVLSLFGRQGERVHVRAKSTRGEGEGLGRVSRGSPTSRAGPRAPPRESAGRARGAGPAGSGTPRPPPGRHRCRGSP